MGGFNTHTTTTKKNRFVLLPLHYESKKKTCSNIMFVLITENDKYIKCGSVGVFIRCAKQLIIAHKLFMSVINKKFINVSSIYYKLKFFSLLKEYHFLFFEFRIYNLISIYFI